MFIGHYSASLVAKAVDPRLPLGALFFAAQAVDVLWTILALTGIERVELVAGYTATNDYALLYVPYSHSLVATMAWAGLAAGVWSLGRWRWGWRGSATLVAAVVLSHWFADLIVHTPDLALVGTAYKQGLGLWNYPYLNLGLETALLFGALAFYLRRTAGRRRNMVLAAIALVAIQTAALLGPRPTTLRETATTALLVYIGFALVADVLDRRRHA